MKLKNFVIGNDYVWDTRNIILINTIKVSILLLAQLVILFWMFVFDFEQLARILVFFFFCKHYIRFEIIQQSFKLVDTGQQTEIKSAKNRLWRREGKKWNLLVYRVASQLKICDTVTGGSVLAYGPQPQCQVSTKVKILWNCGAKWTVSSGNKAESGTSDPVCMCINTGSKDSQVCKALMLFLI